MNQDLHLFISLSEERLNSVKYGQILSKTLKKQKNRYQNKVVKQEGLPFNTQPKDLSPAMKEYYSSRKFSPKLESKKFWNLEQFFLEKFRMVNNTLTKETVPKLQDTFNSERKSAIKEIKLTKSLSPVPFRRKLSEEDKKIAKMINTERIIQIGRKKEIEEISLILKQNGIKKKLSPKNVSPVLNFKEKPQTRTFMTEFGEHNKKESFHLPMIKTKQNISN